MEEILYNYYQNSRVLMVVPIFIILFVVFIFLGVKLYKTTLHSYLIEKIIFLGVPLLIFVISTIFLGNMAIRQAVVFNRCMNNKCQSIILNKDDISIEYSPYRDTDFYHIAFEDHNGILIKPLNSFHKEELEKIFSHEGFSVEYTKYRDDITIYRITSFETKKE